MSQLSLQLGYQVRMEGMGVYQGSFIGLGLWYPATSEPEQGIYEFHSEQEAENFIQRTIDASGGMFGREQFIIEPYDSELNDQLTNAQLRPTVGQAAS